MWSRRWSCRHACQDDVLGLETDELAGRTLKAGGFTKWEGDLIWDGLKDLTKK